jgi:4-amino-4-deoxy-L-arabinose transferase-like glycosyltransferase
MLGVSEWSVRLIPALVGTLTIPILYYPVKQIFNTRTALIFALLLAVSPWHVQWSQNGRFYAALMLLYALASFAFYFGIERNRPAYLLVGFLLFYLALSERMIAGLLAPAVAVYIMALLLFRFARPPGLNWRNLALLLAPAVAVLGLEVYGIVVEGAPRLLAEADIFVGNAVDSPLRILLLILFNIGLPVFVLGGLSGVWLVRQRSRGGLFCSVSAVTPLILWLAVSPWAFVVDRYALVVLPFWLILAAVAVERLAAWLPQNGRWLAAGVLGLLLADAAGSHMMYYQINMGNRPDWRGAFAYVVNHKGPDDLVVTTRPPVGAYYLETGDMLDMAAVTPEQLAAVDKTIWFVTDSEGVWYAPPDTKAWVEEHARLLLVSYLRVREEINLKVYRYEPESTQDP